MYLVNLTNLAIFIFVCQIFHVTVQLVRRPVTQSNGYLNRKIDFVRHFYGSLFFVYISIKT